MRHFLNPHSTDLLLGLETATIEGIPDAVNRGLEVGGWSVEGHLSLSVQRRNGDTRDAHTNVRPAER